MSDVEEDEKPFLIESAKTGRANCKKCKQKCNAGELRIARVVANPFGSGKLNNWFHIDCLFESFKTQRATTRSIETIDDINGWETIGDLDKDSIMEKLMKHPKFINNVGAVAVSSSYNQTTGEQNIKLVEKHYKKDSKDNLFREFRRICDNLSDESSYLGKTAILHKFFLKGCNGKRFEGKLFMWIKMLLPAENKRIYNLQSKQLIKLFARIFNSDPNEMLTHLEQGDVSETILEFFEKSDNLKPIKKSILTLDDVDRILDKLSQLTKEDEQILHFRKMCKICTSNDLKMIIRFIKHDIKINSGPKHILSALSKDAYPAYQSSRNLQDVVSKFGDKITENVLDTTLKTTQKKDSIGVQLMSPISPMLAEACKSVEKAIEKCPAGMYSEIKYDGERVQLHKKGDEFKFFSRNLKPVLEHKVSRCRDFIPKAFPNANDLILDSEIVVVDTTTGELMPFGTLGKHKKTEFETAEVCLFVFDCIYYNGKDLTKKTLQERRKILEDNICPIKNHVQLSEYHTITEPKQLSVMITKVLQMGLEGLVLKKVNGIYEPGKRHWLKVKKDYLFDGKMADSADLVVLGAWYGSGKKGGMLSIFLMGCLDTSTKLWKTVTKVHTGFDDKTMDKMQKILLPLTSRADPDNPPKWLTCKKALIPDLLAKDPTKMPVWEITGAEFSKSDVHTANGISIRFPRITKQRDDKSYKEATNLKELGQLFQASKECTNLDMLTDGLDDADIDIKTKLSTIDNKPSPTKIENITKENPLILESITRKRSNNSDTSDTGATGESSKLKKVAGDDNNTVIAQKKKRTNIDIFIDSSVDGEEIPTKHKTSNVISLSPMAAASSNEAKQIVQKTEPNIENNSKEIAGMVARHSDKNIFKGVLLYVPTELRDDVKKELRYFLLWGGRELNITKKCTHMLHKNGSLVEDWNIVREKYIPTCRHVHYSWLVDSVRKKEQASVIEYPVTILTSCTDIDFA